MSRLIWRALLRRAMMQSTVELEAPLMTYTTLAFHRFIQLIIHPNPIGCACCAPLLKRLRALPYDVSLMFETLPRPHYGYCVYHAARLATRLGHERMTVIEFGVAGGNGLVVLEDHVERIAADIEIDIDVVGFDLGSGLPVPKDYRDMPNVWQAGFCRMDVECLKARLHDAELFLGEVGEEVEKSIADDRQSPVGAPVFDMDFYSSTLSSFRIFDLPHEQILPRVFLLFRRHHPRRSDYRHQSVHGPMSGDR